MFNSSCASFIFSNADTKQLAEKIFYLKNFISVCYSKCLLATFGGKPEVLYDSSNRLSGKIEESLWEGPQQNDDHDKKDSENRCGQSEIER